MNQTTAPLFAAVTDEFRRLAPELPGANEQWLRDGRGEALARFTQTGLPHTRLERWRHTDVAPIATHPYRFATGAGPAPSAKLAGLDNFEAMRLVLVDGWLDESRSTLRELPPGLSIQPLAQAIEQRHPFVMERIRARMSAESDAFQLLNDIFLGGGVFIDLGEGQCPSLPLQLLFTHGAGVEATMSHPRIMIRCGANSTLQLIESYVASSVGPYFHNALTELVLEPGATVAHYRIQREGGASQHIGRLYVDQWRGSNYDSFVFTSGAALSRQEINCTMRAPQANCRLRGLYLADGEQLVDHHICVDHAHPETRSDSHYRGIVNGHAKAVFNGRIVVRPDAQRIAAQLQNRNLLLSPRAEIDTKPELEIHADDVQCTHGATVGQLDEQALFYLRSRGIGAEVARGMLTYAFAEDLIDQIAIPGLRAALGEVLLGHLPMAGNIQELA